MNNELTFLIVLTMTFSFTESSGPGWVWLDTDLMIERNMKRTKVDRSYWVKSQGTTAVIYLWGAPEPKMGRLWKPILGLEIPVPCLTGCFPQHWCKAGPCRSPSVPRPLVEREVSPSQCEASHLLYWVAVQVTRELLLLTSPVMFTLDLAVTRWLDGHMVRESLSSVRLTPCPADHTWTGRG